MQSFNLNCHSCELVLVSQAGNHGRGEGANSLLCTPCHRRATSARKVQLGWGTLTASAATAKVQHELGPSQLQKGKILFAS